jgi:serine/threonine-protein kinase
MTADGSVATSSHLPSAFGRYTLLERLAVGGMAEVFRSKIVLSHGFEKILVIKRILPHLAVDRNFVSMFIEEAKLTAQLSHSKIVQILDFGEVDGQYFIALELIDGFDALALLRTCAQRRMRPPTPLAVFVIMEVLEALDYAHNARDMSEQPMHIVHRDISPSNIFISKHGDVKLGDFGIAHVQERESKTQSGTLKGKYGYMSPEQVKGGPLDSRSDLYAVGVVLAEMLMGRRLFMAPSDLELLLMVRDGRLDRLDKYGCDLPNTLDAIVRRALKPDPAERYETATAFRDALADYLLESGERVSAGDLRAFSSELFGGGASPSAQPQGEQKAPKAVTSGGSQGRAFSAPSTGSGVRPRSGDPVAEPPGPAPVSGGAVTTGAGSGQAGTSDLDRFPARHEPGTRFVSSAPLRTPDGAGDAGVISPMRIFSELAVARETGLLHFELPDRTKEIYLVGGAPASVISSLPSERFGEYLVAKGALRPSDLERVLSVLPRYAGRLGETVVGLGFLKPLEVFRLLSEQVRDQVVDVFTWTESRFAFFRGVTDERQGFPLGLNAFEILGLGVLNIPEALFERTFAPVLDAHPCASGRTHIAPAAFGLGPAPGEVLRAFARRRTLRAWLPGFVDPVDHLTFMRSLYLLVENDLARFE